MKKLVIGTALIILITVFLTENSDKKSMARYVQKNHDELEAYCEKISENIITTTEYYDKYEATYWPSTGIVEFMYKDIFLHKPYAGFYYSHDDIPLGFQGTDKEFTKKDEGWIWYEDTGDNWEYTEKIMDKWYWFEMHF